MSPQLLISNTINYRVYYRDSDAAGVMYYGRYADVFEMGRTELFRSIGVNARALQFSSDIVFPVSTYSVKYIKPAFLDDMLKLETNLIDLGKCTVACSYQLFNAENKELLATASSINVSVKLSSMRPVRLPKVLVDAVNGGAPS